MAHTQEQTDAIAKAYTSLTNHAPAADQLRAIEKVRERAKDLVTEIIGNQPASRERSLAVTALEQSVMWAVKGTILNGT